MGNAFILLQSISYGSWWYTFRAYLVGVMDYGHTDKKILASQAMGEFWYQLENFECLFFSEDRCVYPVHSND
jgi:hypothetical protein